MFAVKLLVAKMFTTKLPRTPQMDATEAVEVRGVEGGSSGGGGDTRTERQPYHLW